MRQRRREGEGVEAEKEGGREGGKERELRQRKREGERELRQRRWEGERELRQRRREGGREGVTWVKKICPNTLL